MAKDDPRTFFDTVMGTVEPMPDTAERPEVPPSEKTALELAFESFVKASSNRNRSSRFPVPCPSCTGGKCGR